MTRLTTVTDLEAAAERAAQEIARALKDALEHRGVAHLGLSGGRHAAPRLRAASHHAGGLERGRAVVRRRALRRTRGSREHPPAGRRDAPRGHRRSPAARAPRPRRAWTRGGRTGIRRRAACARRTAPRRQTRPRAARTGHRAARPRRGRTHGIAVSRSPRGPRRDRHALPAGARRPQAAARAGHAQPAGAARRAPLFAARDGRRARPTRWLRCSPGPTPACPPACWPPGACTSLPTTPPHPPRRGARHPPRADALPTESPLSRHRVNQNAANVVH